MAIERNPVPGTRMKHAMRLSNVAWACAAVAQLLALGCLSVQEVGDQADGAASKVETTGVLFALPAGLAVRVDGEARGVTPLDVLALDAGPHELGVTTPCGAFEAKVVVVEGKTTTATASQFEGLAFAKLKVVATAQDGSTLAPTATLGDWSVPGGAATETEVPACPQRLRVNAPGVGGFVEDLELAAGKTYARQVVLTRGADMVRIPGGKFVTGPPAAQRHLWEESDFKIYSAEVATFDLDKHEVTTAEFHACRKQEGCVPTRMLLTISSGPLEKLVPICTTKTYDRERQPLAGRADTSMNCVANWEAEQYCAWVGKRLPNVEEWEFAARDRGADKNWYKADADCLDPTGPACKLRPSSGPAKPCAVPADTTVQGVCDIMGNVSELVTPTKASGPFADEKGGDFRVPRMEPFMVGSTNRANGRSAFRGFRCARDVTEVVDGD